MEQSLKDLQNLLFPKEIDASEVSLYFASFLEAYRNFDVVIDDKDATETALHALSHKESKLPNLTIFDSTFKYEKYFENVFNDKEFELPIDDLRPVYSNKCEPGSRLLVIGKAEEAYKYIIHGLRLYKNKSVFVFGNDSTEEYDVAFSQLEDAAPINTSETFEKGVCLNALSFRFTNLVELSGCEDRIDIILLKDNYVDIQKKFIKLLLNYQYRDGKIPYIHIFIEDESLFEEFKDNEMCVLYNETLFAELLKINMYQSIRNLSGFNGEVNVTYLGSGKNNVALFKALDSENGYTQQMYKNERLSDYSAKGMIFVDTGDFEKDLLCIKSVRSVNKEVPIYWLNNDLDKMIIFKYFFKDERLFALNTLTLNIADFKIRDHGHAYDENNSDQEKLDNLLSGFSNYGYMAYKISRNASPFDKSILEKAQALAKSNKFAELKELYNSVDENNVCYLEDFRNKAKDICATILARLEILYYFGKYAPKEELETEKIKLAVIRYAKIIDFAGGNEWVYSSFENLIDYLIPYFVKCNKNDENLIYVYQLIVALYKVYKLNVNSEISCKIHMISQIFDIENNKINRSLFLERMVYPCYEVMGFHNEDDESKYSETYVELYKELAKQIANVNCSDNFKNLVKDLTKLLSNKSTTSKELQETFHKLDCIKYEDR